MKIHIAPLLLCVLISAASYAQTTQPVATATVDVWPAGKMPGAPATQPEGEHPSKDGFTRITNVSRPTLALFAAPRTGHGASGPAPAMIVCPGGGYRYVVVD